MTESPIPDDILAALPIFHAMSDDQRAELAKIAHRCEYQPGEVVLAQGESSQNLWIVLSGRCRVARSVNSGVGRVIDLAELGPRDQFGEMSFFHAAPHSASIEALTPLKLLRIDRADYDRLVAAGSIGAHKLALNCVDDLADRLRRMDEWVTDLLCKSANQQDASEWTRFREKLFSNSGH
jgi:CRP-like cAMP-binding protein